MRGMKRGEIIAVGSELLLGGRLDTNSRFLAEQLGAAGVEVRYKTAVGDDEADVATAVRAAVRRADVVVMTGGIGPTSDDRTREAVARVTRRPLRRQAQALAMLRERLATWKRAPTSAQLKQALIPAGSEVLRNPVGSAPGFALTWRGVFLAVLPGVPAEAEAMSRDEVVPRLALLSAEGRHPEKRPRIERRVFQTYGILEADLDARLHPLLRKHPGTRLGLLASPLGVQVSFTAVVAKDEQRARLDRLARSVLRLLGHAVVGEDEASMESVVGHALAERGLTLAVAESCTGGLIGHRLTQVPGSSSFLDRVLVCYSNRAKEEELDVPPALIRRRGAVSAPVAGAMARGVRVKARSDVGLSVTGIAGPSGGSAQKPVGLVFVGLDARARDGKPAVRMVREHRFHGSRDTIKMRASQAALNLVRLWLSGGVEEQP
jgi:nicotinamide-nucleotide amidase